MIQLDANPFSDLTFEIPKESSQFYLDFGWDRFPLDPTSPVHLNAALLAVEELVKQTEGEGEVIFLISDGNLSSLFKEKEQHEPLFLANLLSDYLHRLAALLPDRLTPVLQFGIDSCEQLPKLLLLLCRRRFEHFTLRFTHLVVPVEGEAKYALLLPQDEAYDPARFAPVLEALESKSFIAVPEELFNEHWDGIDHVIVDPNSLGEIGERMLHGFEAAGGEIEMGWFEKTTPKSE